MGAKRAGDGGRGGGQHSKKPRRNKAKYLASGKKSYGGSGIPTGVEGFLVTCMAGKEFASSREVINVLDQVWEEATAGGGQSQCASKDRKSPGAEEGGAPEGEGGEEEEDGDDEEEEEGEEDPDEEEEAEGEGEGEEEEGRAELTRRGQGLGSQGGSGGGGGGSAFGGDIDKLLESEMEGIRTKKKVQFTFSDTGCKGLVFIRQRRPNAKGPGPAQLAETIVRHTYETKQTRTRYTMKLLPAEATCYASVPEIERSIGPILQRHFPSGEQQTSIKYAIVVEARAHAGLDRMGIIKAVAARVPPPHSVDLSTPEKTILVQVVKTACTLAVVSDFKTLAKYNLRQIVCPDESQPKPKGGSAEADPRLAPNPPQGSTQGETVGGGDKSLESSGKHGERVDPSTCGGDQGEAVVANTGKGVVDTELNSEKDEGHDAVRANCKGGMKEVEARLGAATRGATEGGQSGGEVERTPDNT